MNLFTPFADRKRHPKRPRFGPLVLIWLVSWAVAIAATINLANQTWHAATGFLLPSTLNDRAKP